MISTNCQRNEERCTIENFGLEFVYDAELVDCFYSQSPHLVENTKKISLDEELEIS